MEESNNAETVKVTAPLAPLGVATVTFAGPTAASLAMAKVAVIRVGLTTTAALIVTPLAPTAITAPGTKPLPVSVTGTMLPRVPIEGVMAVRTGRGGRTVKSTGGAAPPEVVT